MTYWFPTLAFSIFTFALFGLPLVPLAWQAWVLMAVVSGCVALGWMGGVVHQLKDRQLSPLMLLAFLLLTEALIWGAYSPFMHPQFRQGVYVMHIAIASFYHYLRSYAFAREKRPGSAWLSFAVIASINIGLITLGSMVLHQASLKPLQGLWGAPYFTFWVGLHLYSSDVFNKLRPHTYKAHTDAPG